MPASQALAHGLRDGIVRGRRSAVEGDRQDVDVELVGVTHHPIDSGRDLRRRGVAVTAGDLDRHDSGVRCDAQEAILVVRRRVGAGLVAGDDPGQVRAMPEAVDRGRGRIEVLGTEVDRHRDLAGRRQRLDRGDPCVDERDIDAGSGDPLLPELARSDLIGDR